MGVYDFYRDIYNLLHFLLLNLDENESQNSKEWFMAQLVGWGYRSKIDKQVGWVG